MSFDSKQNELNMLKHCHTMLSAIIKSHKDNRNPGHYEPLTGLELALASIQDEIQTRTYEIESNYRMGFKQT